jgi:Uma2 family endonuclease
MSVPTSQLPVSNAGDAPAGIPADSLPHREPSTAGFAQTPAPPPYPIHRFTVAQYEAIGRQGILTEDDNVELLEGWIVPKTTKYPPHDSTIDLLQFLLTKILPLGWYPRVQNVVVTDDSEPEPDVTVVRGRPGDYRRSHPTGTDVGLVIEVADSTVQRDRRKAKIYARAGIPHYWIINLDERQIETYAQPTGGGADAVYQSRQLLRGGDDTLTVTLDGAALRTLLVRDVLG